MNIAETALAQWSATNENPTQHGPFLCVDWETLRITVVDGGSGTDFNIVWLNSPTDTVTLQESFSVAANTTFDVFRTIRAPFVRFDQVDNGVTYTAELWPSDIDADSSVSDLWTFDGTTLFPTTEPTDFSVDVTDQISLAGTTISEIASGNLALSGDSANLTGNAANVFGNNTVQISVGSGGAISILATSTPAGTDSIQIYTTEQIRIQGDVSLIIRTDGIMSILGKPTIIDCDHATGNSLVLQNLPSSAIIAGTVYRDGSGFLKAV